MSRNYFSQRVDDLWNSLLHGCVDLVAEHIQNKLILGIFRESLDMGLVQVGDIEIKDHLSLLKWHRRPTAFISCVCIKKKLDVLCLCL